MMPPRRRSRRRLAEPFHRIGRPLLGMGLALALAPTATLAEEMVPQDERKVKTAFLFNFAKYVHWSDGGEAGALRLCVVGATPLGETLRLLEGREVGGEPIEVHPLAAGASAVGCRVLFVDESEADELPLLLPSVAAGHTLTVSDMPRFLEAGGMIQLFMEGGRVRFGVNLDALRASRLTVSSRLLRLARRRIEAGKE